MTERAVGGLHGQWSKLLIICLGAAIAMTAALAVALAIGGSGPPRGPGPQGQPPPPPDQGPLVLIVVITGLVVLAWLATLVVMVRDQVIARLSGASEIGALRADLGRLTELVANYGEQRETDGYLSAMRMATAGETEPNVRSIRRPPAPR